MFFIECLNTNQSENAHMNSDFVIKLFISKIYIGMKNVIYLHCLHTLKHPQIAMLTCLSICPFGYGYMCAYGFLSASLNVCYWICVCMPIEKQHATRQMQHGAPWFGDPIVMLEQ